jgi:hypothetical protein
MCVGGLEVTVVVGREVTLERAFGRPAANWVAPRSPASSTTRIVTTVRATTPSAT